MLRGALVGLVTLGAACTGTIDAGDQVAGLTPAQQLAQEAWIEKALPVFKPECTMCHDGTNPMYPDAPAYLAGAKDLDIRDTAIAFMPPVVNLGAPGSSRVISRGMHEGPMLTSPQISDVTLWIQAERDARPPGTVAETAKAAVMLCTAGNPGDATCPINHLDTTAAGAAGTVDFVVQQVGPDLYFTNLAITAGAGGLTLAHPLFESYPATATDPTPNPNDRYFNVSLSLAAGASSPLGTGTATFTGFGITNPISVRFDSLTPMM